MAGLMGLGKAYKNMQGSVSNIKNRTSGGNTLPSMMANRMNSGQSFESPIVSDSRDSDLQKQFANMKTLQSAQKAEAQRQGDVLYKQALASSGGFGGAGLKLGEQAKNRVEQEYGQQGLQLGAQEAEARQNLASMKSQEALQKRQLAFTEWYGKQELDENKKTNVINAMIAWQKSGIKDPQGAQRIWNSLGKVYSDPNIRKPGQPFYKARYVG